MQLHDGDAMQGRLCANPESGKMNDIFLTCISTPNFCNYQLKLRESKTERGNKPNIVSVQQRLIPEITL